MNVKSVSCSFLLLDDCNLNRLPYRDLLALLLTAVYIRLSEFQVYCCVSTRAQNLRDPSSSVHVSVISSHPRAPVRSVPKMGRSWQPDYLDGDSKFYQIDN